jgi:hypothetical protein
MFKVNFLPKFHFHFKILPNGHLRRANQHWGFTSFNSPRRSKYRIKLVRTGVIILWELRVHLPKCKVCRLWWRSSEINLLDRFQVNWQSSAQVKFIIGKDIVWYVNLWIVKRRGGNGWSFHLHVLSKCNWTSSQAIFRLWSWKSNGVFD